MDALTPAAKDQIRSARAQRDQGRFAEAIATLEALRLDGVTSTVLLELGRTYLAAGIDSKGRSALAEALELDPTNERAAALLSKLVRRLDRHSRSSIGDMLAFVEGLGFRPQTVIDVGVHTGTPGLYDQFPEANILLVEPVLASEPYLQGICERYPNARYELAAAGATDGMTTISLGPSHSNSTVVDLMRHGGEEQKVKVERLDTIVTRHRLPGPFILKIDTEGYELEVLRGAPETLKQTELVIAETRTRPVGNAPLFYEMLQFFEESGFAFYDFIGRGVHRSDGVLKMFDMVVVKKNGYFRTPERYKSFGDADLTASTAAKIAKRESAKKNLGLVGDAEPSEVRQLTKELIRRFDLEGSSVILDPSFVADFPPLSDEVLDISVDYATHPAYLGLSPVVEPAELVSQLAPTVRRIMGAIFERETAPRAPFGDGGGIDQMRRDGAMAFRSDDGNRRALAELLEPDIEAVKAHRRTVDPSGRGNVNSSRMLIKGSQDTPVSRLIRDVLRRSGAWSVAETYMDRPLAIQEAALNVKDETDTNLYNVFRGAAPDPKSIYTHIDTDLGRIKAAIYLNDITTENGPFRYVIGSNRSSMSLFERAFRITSDISGLDTHHKVAARQKFMSLPPHLRMKANFGNDLLEGSAQHDAILARERAFTSDGGHVVLFDNRGFHRGGIVDKGERLAIFVILR